MINKNQSLAVQYRPQTFEEVVGQNITVKILNKVVETKSFKNCYGFFGASGTGKTTCARIFAKAINNGAGEPIEIDGATAGDVDSIRSIVSSASERALEGEYKVFIIDECQMLGGGRKENSPAWTALLKCFEECPKYTIFILCSTDPEKIPTAILNRLQRYNFAPLTTNLIKTRLEYIAQKEGFTNYQPVCDLISKMSMGSMRNAISYLEQCADYSTDLDIDIAKQILNGFSYESVFKLTWSILDSNEEGILSIVDNIYSSGQDLKYFIDWYLNFILDLLKYSLFKNLDLISIPAYLETPSNSVISFTLNKPNAVDYLNSLIDKLLDIKVNIKYDLNYKATIIVMLLQVARSFKREV